jgi:hypothetical protein
MFHKQSVFLKIFFLASLGILTSTLSACRPYHRTPLDALTEWPGYLANSGLNLVQVLRQEQVAGGIVLLYLYPMPESELGKGMHCVATTFVTSERNGSWRAQSASQLGCAEQYPAVSRFEATYTVGGNITDLTTAYGLSPDGSQVRIEWSDGLLSTATLQNRVFLASRPQTLKVRRIELLGADGSVLDTWNGSN